jgi:hypothetical protein
LHPGIEFNIVPIFLKPTYVDFEFFFKKTASMELEVSALVAVYIRE